MAKRKLKAARSYIHKVMQPSPRSYSKWMHIGPVESVGCCDCGLVHTIQYKVRILEKSKKVKLFSRVKRAVGDTANRRRHRKYPLWRK